MKEKLKGKELVKTTVDADGNIELSFRSESGSGIRIVYLLLIPFLLTSCVAGNEFFLLLVNKKDTAFMMATVFSFILTGFIVYKMTQKKDKITIVKNKGIKFLDQELPFSSIDDLKKMKREMLGGKGVYSYQINAIVRGRDVLITRELTQSAVNELYEKIIFHSTNE